MPYSTETTITIHEQPSKKHELVSKSALIKECILFFMETANKIGNTVNNYNGLNKRHKLKQREETFQTIQGLYQKIVLKYKLTVHQLKLAWIAQRITKTDCDIYIQDNLTTKLTLTHQYLEQYASIFGDREYKLSVPEYTQAGPD